MLALRVDAGALQERAQARQDRRIRSHRAESAGASNYDALATSPEIVGLIGSRLAAGQSIADSNQRFSDTLFTGASGAASSVGGAAGLIISAPAAAIDTNARDTYDERPQNFGGDLFGR